MHTLSIQRLLGVVLIGLLAACTPFPELTPTPAAPVANVATIVVERETETAMPTAVTPTPTLLPSPPATASITASPFPTRTATSTPQLKPTPPTSTSSPIPDPNLRRVMPSNTVHNVILSSEGRLAFITGGSLYIETQPGSGEFLQIGQHVVLAAWSPNGRQLLYTVETGDTTGLQEQRLWSAVDNTDNSLSDLILNYPEPPYNVRQIYWSPDGTKILLECDLEERHEAPPGDYYDAILAAVDLTQHTFTDNQVIDKTWVLWLTNDVYILRYHCGSPCASISAHDYTGQLVWTPYWDTGGMVDFAPNGNFMISLGRIDTTVWDDYPAEPYQTTVDEISLTSGEVKAYWERPREDEYFTPFIMPQISPDEQLISFNYGGTYGPDIVYIIDRSGQEYGQFANSYALDWRPNGGLALSHILATGEHRLLYFDLHGTTQAVFTTTQGIQIASDMWLTRGGVAWSADGRFFTFTTHNNNQDTEQLYLWQPGNGEPRLIYSTNQGQGIYDLTWLPNSQGFYFTVGNELWRYDVQPAAP